MRLVELAALQDGELVAHAIAAVLGVHERSGESILETLRSSLSASHRLLVLDSCEHLALSCARVAEVLLQACPRLTIVATRREPLRIGPENIWRVPSLGLPNHDTRHGSGLAEKEAVRLFIDRAAAVLPGFAPRISTRLVSRKSVAALMASRSRLNWRRHGLAR